jgi:hypothetical protein
MNKPEKFHAAVCRIDFPGFYFSEVHAGEFAEGEGGESCHHY